jgi:superfamily II RNA helicase
MCARRGRERGRGAGGRGDKAQADLATNIRKIIKMIKDRNYEPVIVFSFSRRCVRLGLCSPPSH